MEKQLSQLLLSGLHRFVVVLFWCIAGMIVLLIYIDLALLVVCAMVLSEPGMGGIDEYLHDIYPSFVYMAVLGIILLVIRQVDHAIKTRLLILDQHNTPVMKPSLSSAPPPDDEDRL